MKFPPSPAFTYPPSFETAFNDESEPDDAAEYCELNKILPVGTEVTEEVLSVSDDVVTLSVLVLESSSFAHPNTNRRLLTKNIILNLKILIFILILFLNCECLKKI